MKALGNILLSILFALITVLVFTQGVQYRIKKQGTIKYHANHYYFNSALIKEDLTKSDVLLLGSSEITSDIDTPTYPSRFLHRPAYQVVPVGRGHMQSLSHALFLGNVEASLENRTVFFLISPQWFTPAGIDHSHFQAVFSIEHYRGMLENPNLSDGLKEKIKTRVKTLGAGHETLLKEMELAEDDSVLGRVIQSVNEGWRRLKTAFNLMFKSDALRVPQRFETTQDNDFESAWKEAEQRAKAHSTNEFQVDDKYYERYLVPILDQIEVKPAVDYRQSMEMADLNLFVELCKEVGITPVLINTAVNGKWYDQGEYPKLHREALREVLMEFSKAHQVRLEDLSVYDYEPYYLKDIMHLGQKGWVSIDEIIDREMETKDHK